ncbi:ribonuclease H-like domain-containing protein [Aspergillus unguis]
MAEIKIVDSLSTLQDCLATLSKTPASPPQLFIDLEGTNLSRQGTLSIVSIYAAHKQIVYLIDVLKLGAAAFAPVPGTGTKPAPKLPSLQSILESRSIQKVIFDVRNDSDALFGHYNIRLAGVQDLQLMELAGRRGSKKYVSGLAKCIERDLSLSGVERRAWKERKDEIVRLLNAAKGAAGGYEVFDERPMPSIVREYCAADVVHLPALYKVYNQRMSRAWKAKMQAETDERVRLSQQQEYEANGKDKVLGPWGQNTHQQPPILAGDPEDTYTWEDDLKWEAKWAAVFGDIEDEFSDFFDDYWDDYQDLARDCIGWEEDMIKNGELF